MPRHKTRRNSPVEWQRAGNNPRYVDSMMIPPDSSFDMTWAPRPILAGGSSDPQYSYEQFYRTNPGKPPRRGRRNPSAADAVPVRWGVPKNAGPFLPQMFPYGMGGRPYEYDFPAAKGNPASPPVERSIRGASGPELIRDLEAFEARKAQAKASGDAWGVVWWGDRVKVARAELKKRRARVGWKEPIAKPNRSRARPNFFWSKAPVESLYDFDEHVRRAIKLGQEIPREEGDDVYYLVHAPPRSGQGKAWYWLDGLGKRAFDDAPHSTLPKRFFTTADPTRYVRSNLSLYRAPERISIYVIDTFTGGVKGPIRKGQALQNKGRRK